MPMGSCVLLYTREYIFLSRASLPPHAGFWFFPTLVYTLIASFVIPSAAWLDADAGLTSSKGKGRIRGVCGRASSGTPVARREIRSCLREGHLLELQNLPNPGCVYVFGRSGHVISGCCTTTNFSAALLSTLRTCLFLTSCGFRGGLFSRNSYWQGHLVASLHKNSNKLEQNRGRDPKQHLVAVHLED